MNNLLDSSLIITKLVFPPSGRARKVVKRSNLRITGKHPSIKNEASVHWESLIERDLIFLLDTMPTAVQFQEQPMVIHYQWQGRQLTHTPDLLVHYDGRKIIFEVKAQTNKSTQEALDRASLLEEELLAYGYEYYVVFDTDIRHEPFLGNAKRLHHWGSRPVSAEQRIKLCTSLRSLPTTFRELKANHSHPHLPCIAARLIIDGYLHIDRWSQNLMAAPITLASDLHDVHDSAMPWHESIISRDRQLPQPVTDSYRSRRYY